MPSGTLTIYDSFWKLLLDGGFDLDSDTIKVALVSSSYTPDRTVHDYWDDVSGSEVSGTGYSAGGTALSGKTISQDNVNDRGTWSADDPSWASVTVTFRYAVLYKSTGTAGTSALIGYVDFGADQVYSAGTVTIDFPAAGILTPGGTLSGAFRAFNAFYAALLGGSLNLGGASPNTLKLALVTSGWTPDVDAHDYWDDVSANEASGTGYTAGGATLAGQATTVDTTNHCGVLSVNDVTWSAATITFRYLVLYRSTGTAGTSNLIGYWDLGADYTYTAQNVKADFSGSGIFSLGG